MNRKLQAWRELEEPPVGPVNGMGGMQESKLSTVMQPPAFPQPSGVMAWQQCGHGWREDKPGATGLPASFLNAPVHARLIVDIILSLLCVAQVGQRVTARHPVTRQLHDGDILTTGGAYYRHAALASCMARSLLSLLSAVFSTGPPCAVHGWDAARAGGVGGRCTRACAGPAGSLSWG